MRSKQSINGRKLLPLRDNKEVGMVDISWLWFVIVARLLLARSLMNSYVLDKVAKVTERSETTLDDEIIESNTEDFLRRYL